MQTVFLDTNFFLQCKELDQLPWTDIFGDNDHIVLFIPRAVQEEIDRLKHDGNSRRAKRARKANSFIRDIILSDDSKLEIENANVLIEISFPPIPKGEAETPIFLSSASVDDRIIAEIWQYKTDYPGTSPILFTHDTNPLLTAKRCGIDFKVIPDGWLLPPEPDKKDKKIANLEGIVNDLKSNIPHIEMDWLDSSKKIVKKLEVEIKREIDFRPSEIESLLSIAKNKHPMKNDFSQKPIGHDYLLQTNAIDTVLGRRKIYVPPSEQAIDNYQKQEYPDWIDSLTEYIVKIPSHLFRKSRYVLFSLSLSNTGNVPAVKTLVRITCVEGDISIWDPSDIIDLSSLTQLDEPPSPPNPPSGKYKNNNSSLSSLGEALCVSGRNLQNLLPPISNSSSLAELLHKNRDPNLFFYKGDRPEVPAKACVLRCDEYRHKEDSMVFEFVLCIDSTNDDAYKAVIECVITAANLPNPVKKYLNIKIKHVDYDPVGEAKNRIDLFGEMESISSLISRLKKET